MIVWKEWKKLPLTVAAASLSCALSGASVPADESAESESVVVVFNQNLPDSEAVAQHYATKRQIPKDRILGLDLPDKETVSRAVFQKKLQRPLAAIFRKRGWFEFEDAPQENDKAELAVPKVKKSSIRYLTLCYGVPLRIQSDRTIREEGMEELPAAMRRNQAAVDSELATLPHPLKLYGYHVNPVYEATNSLTIRPENGILMVARLDGPSPQIAKRLVDMAIAAEQNGLWGRAYFDLRGLESGEYKLGDDWIAHAAALSRHLGFETYEDRKPGTFPETLPISHAALYAGWYDAHVSGPFRRGKVEFMPGALAYHLHSYSAWTVRSKTERWVGPLLEAGATATMGCVYEPYLALSPHLHVFFESMFRGFSFGEAAYASQPAVSWQTTVVGDPLYRPFANLPALQAKLQRENSPLIEWLILLNINRAIAGQISMDQILESIKNDTEVQKKIQKSAVLSEKLGDLLYEQEKRDGAVSQYQQARQRKPSPQQDLRIGQRLAALLQETGDEAEALSVYLNLIERHPQFAGKTEMLRKAQNLAEKLGLREKLREIQRRLSADEEKAKPPTNEAKQAEGN